MEALSITTSVKHFSPYIVQSIHRTKVLTDNKPCVEAHKKLSRGLFSSSSRVMTFLSTLSHYQVELQHVAGKDNTFSDFASRHPILCDGSCQICSFIADTEDSVVRAVRAEDVLDEISPVPFASRRSWLQLQQNCKDLQKVKKYLTYGMTPGKKIKGVKDVKRYLTNVKLSNRPADGLLIVHEVRPLAPVRQRIVVPRSIVDGLLTAMHIKLSHPSKDQLKKVFNRAFYALDLDRIVDEIVTGCHQCAAMKKIPSNFSQQSTADPPEGIGIKFSADVIKRERQKILFLIVKAIKC